MSAILESEYPCLSTHSLQAGFSNLSTEQKYAFAKFTRGQNIFVTGPGGTGKTRLIQFIVEYMNSIGKAHQVCALTGCAATLLNCKAKTIHSWSGIKLGKGDPEDIIRRVIRSRGSSKAWRSVEVLIVDEVSMMSYKMFDLLDRIGKVARKCNAKAFGGVQLVFTGDFFQLPPIPDQDDQYSGAFCFQHPRWAVTFKPSECIELKTFFRQTDPIYIAILQEVRRGTISSSNIDILKTRLVKKGEINEKNGVVPTKLFPVRAKVETINESSYAKLEGEERVYHFSVNTRAKIRIDNGAALSEAELAHCQELTQEQLFHEVDALMTSLFTEKTFRIKIGALVMCTANIDMDRGICNGSQGVVIGFAEAATAILPEELMSRTATPQLVPVVKFANGVTMKVAPYPRQSEEYPCVVVAQLPLCLAWALTIHKIQGATLDLAEMDIGRSIFAEGQSYVALSRVKTLDGLCLSEFNSTKIKANPLVVEFYNSFPQIGEDEMVAEIRAILSTPKTHRVANDMVELKQTSMNVFMREDKDPNIKTIKLSKY